MRNIMVRDEILQEVAYKLEGRRVWFIIFHVKAMKKVTRIIILGKGNKFLSFQY